MNENYRPRLQDALVRIILTVLLPVLPFSLFWLEFALLFLLFLGSWILLGLIALEAFFYFRQKDKSLMAFILVAATIGSLLAIVYLVINAQFIPSYRYWQIVLLGAAFGLLFSVPMWWHMRRCEQKNNFDKDRMQKMHQTGHPSRLHPASKNV